MNLPLSSLRVISIEQYAAGPYCSMHLAALGAEVTGMNLAAADPTDIATIRRLAAEHQVRIRSKSERAGFQAYTKIIVGVRSAGRETCQQQGAGRNLRKLHKSPVCPNEYQSGHVKRAIAWVLCGVSQGGRCGGNDKLESRVM